jgi:hypothetical protein
MNQSETVYATDEDVALRASADFGMLCPKDQRLASGTDGAFDPSDRWALVSGTVDFAAQGVEPGQVVQLVGPVGVIRPPGESLVVESVAPGSVRLRRKGQASGVGQPPAPAEGLVGVEFVITTLGPQIESASFDLDRRFGIGRRLSELADPREVRDAVVLTVLPRQYLAMSREAGTSQDVLAAKAQALKGELDESLGRLVVHGTGEAGDVVSTRFHTRISR